jgi:hypothetical protein
MFATFAVLAVLPLTPGQTGELTLSNVRYTYGIQGPTRADKKFLPGDRLVLSFDIEGGKPEADGKLRGGIGIEVLDAKGKMQFRQLPRDVAIDPPAGGKSLAAYAAVQIGPDQPPGEYSVKVKVFDRVAGVTRELNDSFEVLPAGFGCVRVTTTTDAEGILPAASFYTGRSFWINCELVGFARAEGKQPHLAITMRALDQQGNPALPEPSKGEVSDEVPPGTPAVPVQFVLRLHQAGKYTIELEATDKDSGKHASLSLPVTVSVAPPVGTRVTEIGTLLRRAEGKQTWEVVSGKGSLVMGDLLLGLPGATLDSADGAVRVTLHSDFDGKSPFPAIESALQMQLNPKVDLDFTLDRGRVELLNRKDAGAAHVLVRVRRDTFELTLSEPGTRVALELSGRWPRGVPFTPTPGPKDVPTAGLVFLVLHGEATLRHAGSEFALTAPPGPALVEWDSVTGLDESPRRVEKLPPWATEGDPHSPQAKAQEATIKKLREALASRPIGPTLMEFVNSEDPEDRRAGVYVLAALDDADDLGKVLREIKHADVLENGILAMRNWIGRGPGQDLRLYQRLREHAKASPVQASTILNLLHTPGREHLARPEIYQALAAYLDHKEAFVRGLAYWHLVRLVPAGEKFDYDPLASKEARAAAVAKWQQLVAKGPPVAAPKGEERKP